MPKQHPETRPTPMGVAGTVAQGMGIPQQEPTNSLPTGWPEAESDQSK